MKEHRTIQIKKSFINVPICANADGKRKLSKKPNNKINKNPFNKV
jgi:hypothetical protein